MVGDSHLHKILRAKGQADEMTGADGYTVNGEDRIQGANSETEEMSRYFSPIYPESEPNNGGWVVWHTLTQV